jgi:hypothetical protein
VPKYTEKQIEMGTDTRNDYLGWNVSAQQDEKQRKIDLANDIARCA